jgi:hypothetical protein
MADSYSKFRTKIALREETGCWIWTGPKTSDGYGIFRIPGKPIPVSASRWSYEYWVSGKLPKSLVVDHYILNKAETMHLCSRSCVNPFHLEAKSRRANAVESELFMAKAPERGRRLGRSRRGTKWTARQREKILASRKKKGAREQP